MEDPKAGNRPSGREPHVTRGRIALGLIGGLLLWAGPALADRDCDVPLTQWQPRAALERKLAAEGWTSFVIRTDDGCYKVKAIRPDGQRMREKFNPATLEPVPHDDDDGPRGHHGYPHEEERDD